MIKTLCDFGLILNAICVFVLIGYVIVLNEQAQGLQWQIDRLEKEVRNRHETKP